MKKKQGKYLKFYYECMETGKIPNYASGLCMHFIIWLGLNRINFFRSGVDLRQTIVLLMAAMNDEL